MSREEPAGRWSRWGTLMHRRRWTVVVAWLLVIAWSAPFLGKLTDNLTSGGFEVPESQSLQVAELKKTDLPGEHVRTSVLVLHSDSLTVDDPAYSEALSRGP